LEIDSNSLRRKLRLLRLTSLRGLFMRPLKIKDGKLRLILSWMIKGDSIVLASNKSG